MVTERAAGAEGARKSTVGGSEKTERAKRAAKHGEQQWKEHDMQKEQKGRRHGRRFRKGKVVDGEVADGTEAVGKEELLTSAENSCGVGRKWNHLGNL
jgi:hypothetical protein